MRLSWSPLQIATDSPSYFAVGLIYLRWEPCLTERVGGLLCFTSFHLSVDIMTGLHDHERQFIQNTFMKICTWQCLVISCDVKCRLQHEEVLSLMVEQWRKSVLFTVMFWKWSSRLSRIFSSSEIFQVTWKQRCVDTIENVALSMLSVAFRMLYELYYWEC